jgi:cyclopropane fatty-acyl-phospholipid synthase-like methyltransferase
LYGPYLAGKKLLDIGCGMGISTICFAEMGARTTFVDIVEDNVALVKRLCHIKGIEANFLCLEHLEDLSNLERDFDVVTALGSLINAPAAVIKAEITLIKQHLRVGGRWLHFAYPKSRWQREGATAFSHWGELTDGLGTPWMEFHDRAKIEWLFKPSKIRVLFECEWHNSDFNWFDIELVGR